MYKGIGASEGIGMGKTVLVTDTLPTYTPRTVEDTNAERARFREAVEGFCEQTEHMAERMTESAGEHEADILRGHIMMIRDPFMVSQIEDGIGAGQCAEAALEAVCDMFIGVFSQADDELTRLRAADVRDIKTRLLKRLLGLADVDLGSLPKGTVLVTHDLTPSMTAGLDKDNITAIVTESGGRTSHSAILSRALGIPAVLSVAGITEKLTNGEYVIVDGSKGEILDDPAPEQVEHYAALREEYLSRRRELMTYKDKPTVTADGVKLELCGNIGSPDEAQTVLSFGGEGVGLFRTEFLFMERASLPSEEEQFEAYKKAALILKGKPLIIRTLDVGGDKDIPYLGLKKEENPFLGYRAVRYCLQNSEMYRSQLRALVRAGAYGDVRIMIPLVTNVEEVRTVREMVAQIMADCAANGIATAKKVPVGVMVETAAASEIADLLAKEADFFSIGTNDLTQYTMSVDRGNAAVAYLYSPLQPAVLRSVRRIISCAKKEGIPVGMCGEAAADPLLIPLLISFGLDEYSVTASSVPAVRKNISRWTKARADEIAEHALSLSTEAEVRAYLQQVTE